MAKQIAMGDAEDPNAFLESLKREGTDMPELAEYENLAAMVSGQFSALADMSFEDLRDLLSAEGEAAFYAEHGAEQSDGEEIDSGFAYMKKEELFKKGPFRFIMWEFSIRENIEKNKPPVLTVEAIGKTAGGEPFRLVDSTFGIAHRLYRVSETRIKEGKNGKAAHQWLNVPGGLSQRPNPHNPMNPMYRMEFRASEM